MHGGMAGSFEESREARAAGAEGAGREEDSEVARGRTVLGNWFSLRGGREPPAGWRG